jgi:hypothetical protein
MPDRWECGFLRCCCTGATGDGAVGNGAGAGAGAGAGKEVDGKL